jgi:hypothetical protein
VESGGQVQVEAGVWWGDDVEAQAQVHDRRKRKPSPTLLHTLYPLWRG